MGRIVRLDGINCLVGFLHHVARNASMGQAAYGAAPKSPNGKVDGAENPAALAAVELETGDVLFSLVNVARRQQPLSQPS